MNLAEQLQESLLGQVFGFALILYDPQARGVDTPAVLAIEPLECRGITFLSQSYIVFDGETVIFESLFNGCRHCIQPLGFPSVKCALDSSVPGDLCSHPAEAQEIILSAGFR